jgi:hypothetical protein
MISLNPITQCSVFTLFRLRILPHSRERAALRL